MPEAIAYVPYAGPVVTRAEAKAAGLKRFFTGIPCPHRHLSQRQTANGQCWGCKKQPSKEYMAAWNVKNHERRKAINQRYREKHPDYWPAYYAKNSATILAQNAVWRKDNKEAAREGTATWHKANPERLKRIHRKWVLRNPEKVAATARTRRATKLAADGSHTVADVLAMLDRQGGKCVYCLKSIRSKYHVDHIVPLADGGSNWISNIQLTCPTCNFRKNRMDPIAFANRLGRLL